jgi:hypothetical protein
MSRTAYSCRILIFTLLVPCISAGQDQGAVRDWIESLLPKSQMALDAEFSSLSPRLTAELKRAGLVSRIEISRPAEDPGKLAVIVGVEVPCGYDDAAYIYDYGRDQPQLVLESHGSRGHGESLSGIRFSRSDALGRQLILTLRYGVQCASSWNRLSYDLFRLSTVSTAVPILSGDHAIWFGADEPYQVRLEPDELLMEIRDRSIDAGIHNRAHILHYDAARTPVERIDPVALQPQDFVDEWLTRPWQEMESRSDEGKRGSLEKWHEFLGSRFVGGDFTIVQACREKSDEWQIGVDLNWINGKELPISLKVYFLIEQSGLYRFKMIDIAFERQEGCAGAARPMEESPSLFPSRGQSPRMPGSAK